MRQGDVEKIILEQLASGEDSDLLKRVRKNNLIQLHNFKKEVTKILSCELEGCEQKFEIKLIPNQILYPKFCEIHRNTFKRDNFKP